MCISKWCERENSLISFCSKIKMGAMNAISQSTRLDTSMTSFAGKTTYCSLWWIPIYKDTLPRNVLFSTGPPTWWCVLSACSSLPCEHGGSCEDTSSGGFTCACTEQYQGPTCATCEDEIYKTYMSLSEFCTIYHGSSGCWFCTFKPLAYTYMTV